MDVVTKKKQKGQQTVFKVDSPYTSPKWPIIGTADQDVILRLLCDLLSPIGHHRKTYITPSKGKRSKKRKRHGKHDTQASLPMEGTSGTSPSVPPLPVVEKHVTIGLNSTTRRLESSLQPTASPTKSLVAIFLTPSSLNYLPYSHLPTLTALASVAHPDRPAIRLIQLPNTAEGKICSALGQPRAGVIGVLADAPATGALLECVMAVEPVDVPWTKEVKAGTWLGTKISTSREKDGEIAKV